MQLNFSLHILNFTVLKGIVLVDYMQLNFYFIFNFTLLKGICTYLSLTLHKYTTKITDISTKKTRKNNTIDIG